MRTVPFILTIIFTLLFSVSKAQDEFPIIDSIAFEGIKKNKRSYLDLFIQQEVGNRLDTNILNKEVQTLQNLPSLFYVSSEIKNLNGKNILVFKCEEAHTFLPFFNFGGGENRESLSFQIGASEHNLFGKGVQVYGYYQYKEKHTFVLNIRNPYLFSSSWGLSLGGKKWTTNEPLYFGETPVRYQYDNYYLEGTGIKTFSLGHHVEFGGAIFREDYTKLSGENMELGPQEMSIDKYLGKFNYQYDKINYFYHYRSGFAFNFNFSTVKTDGMDELFYQGDIYVRYHKRIKKKGNLSFRAGTGLTTNNNSPFAAYVLDSQTNLRGIGDRTIRGTGIFYFNSEYNHTLLDKKWFTILGTAFTDYGTIRLPGMSIDDIDYDNQSNLYAGIGSRFVLKKVYNAVFRIDFGHSLYRNVNNELVIGLGHYF